jgi:hypothetical protein
MPSISRREFLKLTGAGVVSSIVSCSCASHPTPTSTPKTTPSPTVDITPTPEITMPTSILADKVAYVCGCKPNEHNPGGGGNNTLYIGNYCKNSERFLLHWDVSALPEGVKISTAIMGLYCVEIYGTLSGHLVYAPLLSDWGDTVTYATQPENVSQEQVSAEWPVKRQWHEVDITHLVTFWLVNQEKNYGLIGYAVDIQDDTCSAVFNSIHQKPEDLRPKLTLVYGS